MSGDELAEAKSKFVLRRAGPEAKGVARNSFRTRENSANDYMAPVGGWGHRASFSTSAKPSRPVGLGNNPPTQPSPSQALRTSAYSRRTLARRSLATLRRRERGTVTQTRSRMEIKVEIVANAVTRHTRTDHQAAEPRTAEGSLPSCVGSLISKSATTGRCPRMQLIDDTHRCASIRTSAHRHCRRTCVWRRPKVDHDICTTPRHTSRSQFEGCYASSCKPDRATEDLRSCPNHPNQPAAM